jgi:hypothetical protein
MKKRLLFLLVVLPFAGCTDADQARLGGYGKPHRVEVLSGGQVVRVYTSTDKVQARSGGYYFVDSATHKLVQVNGSVIITRLE